MLRGPSLLRTHTCGELRDRNIGQEVTLCGWVDSYRDHGGVLFVDLRDRYGKTQVVFGPESGADDAGAGPVAAQRVRDRRSPARSRRGPKATINPKLATGEIELRAAELERAQQEPDAAVSAAAARNCPARTCGSSTAISTCAGPRCSRR